MARVARFHSEPIGRAITGRARARWFHRTFFSELLGVLPLFGVSGADAVRAAAIMVAHIAAETGEGSGIYNHNPGNIHFQPRGLGTGDWYDGTDHDAAAAAYAVRFAAYPSRVAGLVDKCAIVLRSPARRAALLTGPPEDYFLVLKATGYLENPCGQVVPCPYDYVRGLTRARLAAIAADVGEPWGLGASLVVLGALGAAGWAARELGAPLPALRWPG